MKYLFVDAETDGLYGKFLTVAALVCDEQGRETAQFSCRWKFTENDIESDWVKENVLPYLSEETVVETEEDMLRAFWDFYRSQGEVRCIGDVVYPVESRLFERCVRMKLPEREFQGPFPLLDLGGMLYARGIDPLQERDSLIDADGRQRHRAMDDVRTAHAVWKEYILPWSK